MTIQEALELLRPFRNIMVDQHGCPVSDVVYALDVAIRSLEAWEKMLHGVEELESISMAGFPMLVNAKTIINIIKDKMQKITEGRSE